VFIKYIFTTLYFLFFYFSDNVILSRKCQQPCQHTVCQACYFKTKREPPCPRCSTDDFQCMKKFSKCVRKDTCTRHKYPCEAHQKVWAFQYYLKRVDRVYLLVIMKSVRRSVFLRISLGFFSNFLGQYPFRSLLLFFCFYLKTIVDKRNAI